MASRDRVLAIGRRRANRLRTQVGELLEMHRLRLGLSLDEVARALGTSRTRLRRWELAQGESIGLDEAVVALRLLGQDAVLSTYPTGGVVRDAGHAALIARFLERVPPSVPRILEAPMPIPGDLRAWDVLLEVTGARIGVAAETRLRDGQDLVRRERLKMRDSGVNRLLLVLNDTLTNRQAVDDAGSWLHEAFTRDGRTVWAALRECRDPGGDALLFA